MIKDVNMIRVILLFSGTIISPQFVIFSLACVTLLQLLFSVVMVILLLVILN